MSETIYPNHWEEPMTDINKPLDAHGTRIDLEAEFYCPTCEGFRDVRNHLNDIVCDECHTIIATHRDRVIHVPDSKPPAPPVVETVGVAERMEKIAHAAEMAPDELTCGECGEFVALRDGCEHSGLCDNCAHELAVEFGNALIAAQLEIDRLKAELLWCVEVLESQRHEMDNEGNISTHVSEGKLEELQAIVANQRKEQKS